MSEGCTHNCETCSQNCGERNSPRNMVEKPNPGSRVNKVIGVVSGKGGVGKSLVTSLLAVSMQRKGYKAAVLDADITGPSIPQIFGVHEKARGNGQGILPAHSESGVDLMSINLLLEHESDPVVWRGPVIATTVKQFWTDVVWGDVDFMFVDMPPGTSDVLLTVFQSLPVDGIVTVSAPQELVAMIVGKAVNLAHDMNVELLGLVENMAYFECPDCGKRHHIFGDPQGAAVAERYDIPAYATLPIDPSFARLCDAGKVEDYDVAGALDPIIAQIEAAKQD